MAIIVKNIFTIWSMFYVKLVVLSYPWRAFFFFHSRLPAFSVSSSPLIVFHIHSWWICLIRKLHHALLFGYMLLDTSKTNLYTSPLCYWYRNSLNNLHEKWTRDNFTSYKQQCWPMDWERKKIIYLWKHTTVLWICYGQVVLLTCLNRISCSKSMMLWTTFTPGWTSRSFY